MELFCSFQIVIDRVTVWDGANGNQFPAVFTTLVQNCFGMAMRCVKLDDFIFPATRCRLLAGHPSHTKHRCDQNNNQTYPRDSASCHGLVASLRFITRRLRIEVAQHDLVLIRDVEVLTSEQIDNVIQHRLNDFKAFSHGFG